MWVTNHLLYAIMSLGDFTKLSQYRERKSEFASSIRVERRFIRHSFIRLIPIHSLFGHVVHLSPSQSEHEAIHAVMDDHPTYQWTG